MTKNDTIEQLLQKAHDLREPHVMKNKPDNVLDGIQKIRELLKVNKTEEALEIAKDLYGYTLAMSYNVNTSGYYYIELSETLKEITEYL